MTQTIWKNHGKDLLLTHPGYEGGVSPTQDGGWHWWVRTPSGRYSGECGTMTAAKSTAAMIVTWSENGEDPSFHLSSD